MIQVGWHRVALGGFALRGMHGFVFVFSEKWSEEGSGIDKKHFGGIDWDCIWLL
jgi:hypothetical protein